MYVLDCGNRSATLYNSELDSNLSHEPPSEDSLSYLSHEDLLDIHKHIPRGSELRCEYAHLGCPRRKRSKSQPFTDVQLFEFYSSLEEAGINLLLTPQQSTPRACNRSRLPKSDENDPKSIYLLLEEYPEMSLMKPPKSFTAGRKRTESYDWVEESNLILNNSRGDDYNEDNPLYKFVMDNIKDIFDSSPLLEKVFSVDGCARFKRNNKNRPADEQKGYISSKKLKLNQIYAVLCQLMNEEGEIRLREKTGELAGWSFIKKYALKQTPFHLKGGVARSNLYWYGMRNFISKSSSEELGTMNRKAFLALRRGGYFDKDASKYVPPMTKEEEGIYLKYRQEYSKAIKVLFSSFKKIILEKNLNS